MALAVSQHRLLVFRIGSPLGFGIGGAIKELVGAVPVKEVDRIEVKRLGLGKTVTVTVREPTRRVAAFERARRWLKDGRLTS
jgi:hypothetical protein